MQRHKTKSLKKTKPPEWWKPKKQVKYSNKRAVWVVNGEKQLPCICLHIETRGRGS